MSIDIAKLSLPKKFQTVKNFILDKASSIADAIRNNPKTSAVLITQTALIALLSLWGISESSKNNDLNTRINNLQWSYDNSTKENDQLKKDKKSQESTISDSEETIDSQKVQIQNLKDSIQGYKDQVRDLTHHNDIWYSSIDDLEKKYQELGGINVFDFLDIDRDLLKKKELFVLKLKTGSRDLLIDTCSFRANGMDYAYKHDGENHIITNLKTGNTYTVNYGCGTISVTENIQGASGESVFRKEEEWNFNSKKKSLSLGNHQRSFPGEDGQIICTEQEGYIFVKKVFPDNVEEKAVFDNWGVNIF